MAVKVADTLRPNNSGEEAVKGGFPTALACDVWLADGRSVEEALEGTSGASIQVAEIPEPSEAQFGKIYQYIGETTDDYINGYFYECIIEGAAYKWVEKTVQKSNADISEDEDNVLEQKTDGLYVRKTTAILFVDALPEYGTIDDYIYRIQSSQYKELVIDGSIMNGDDVNAAMQHMTEKGFVVSDPDEPDHEGYYEAVFRFRDIEYHDELTDQYKTISKFYIRKSASIVGDKFIAKLADEELTISSQEDIPLRYKEEIMYLGDKASQSLTQIMLIEDADGDTDAVKYIDDSDLPIPSERKNKLYCLQYKSIPLSISESSVYSDVYDFAYRNRFGVNLQVTASPSFTIFINDFKVAESTNRNIYIAKIMVITSESTSTNKSVTVSLYNSDNNIIKTESGESVTLDLVVEQPYIPYICKEDTDISLKLISEEEFKASSGPQRVFSLPQDPTPGFYQEDAYTTLRLNWASTETLLESFTSNGFTVIQNEDSPNIYDIGFPNGYSGIRLRTFNSGHVETTDVVTEMRFDTSDTLLKFSTINHPNFYYGLSAMARIKYAPIEESADSESTKMTSVNNIGGRERLALYSDVLRNITQKIILPAPSKKNLGKVYQYVGNTNVDYSKGSFYECISDGEETPTYSWRELGSGGSITIKDVNELPTSNIENIIYRLTSTFEVNFNQGSSQMALATKGGFTYTEETVDGVLTRVWTTDTEAYVKKSSTEYQRVNKIIYKYSTDIHNYHKIMYNDEVIDEGTEWGAWAIFYFKIAPAYYAGDTINQKTERLAKYDDIDKSFIGTQAEWDALSVDEKAKYTIVNITDDDAGANLDYYSTEETKTNKVWIDGKPIYRKVYKCTAATTLTAGEDWKNIAGWDIDVSDMAVITYLFGSTNYWGRIDWSKGNNNKLLWCSLISTIIVMLDAALTIEYTKFTD